MDLTSTGAGDPVLKRINFCCRSGDMVCIVGPVGSGKTSLIHAILVRPRCSMWGGVPRVQSGMKRGRCMWCRRGT